MTNAARAARRAISLLALAAGAAACASGGNSGDGPTVPVTPVGNGAVVQAWVTTANQSRLLSQDPDLRFGAGALAPSVIDVDGTRTYQTMVGFGAAFTDASTYLLQTKLTPAARDALLQELFGRNPGIGLSFARLPMGASDFSQRDYSYDDVPAGQTDSTLAHFSIDADRAERLPVVKKALAINPSLVLMANPWSPPGWMKSTNSLIQGTLRPEYYGSFAEYFRKFVEAYKAEGVPISMISIQNEPHFEPGDYPGMRLNPTQRAEIIGKWMGPTFQRAGLSTLILDWDHNWDDVQSPLGVLADTAARKFVSGVAWHCYGGDVSAQTAVHDQYPTKDVYFTECSGSHGQSDTPAQIFAGTLGWHARNLMIGTTRNWARSVALWNLALDEHDGPHLGGCGNCRGVVTINSGTGAITRNVEYWALAHASRFVRPGARRVESSNNVDGLQTVAFRNADDGSTALLVLNTAVLDRTFSVRAGGQSFQHTLPGGAVATYTWP